MSRGSSVQDWTVRRERGSLLLIKLGVWVALGLGRPLARLFLYPICLYFLAFSPTAIRSSRQYLKRVLKRRPRLIDVFRHFRTFASCVLDRVFLLNDQIAQYNVRVHGEEILRDIEQRGGGCLLFGAHIGSFEVTRAVGRRRRNLQVSLLMYEDNARKIRAALAAINPHLETEVIGLGRANSLITVAERLDRGHFIGLLADRNVDGTDMVRCPFLGAPAAFPKGPFRLAMLLQRPIVLMVGLYRGDRTYEVFFEPLADATEPQSESGDAWIDSTMRRYVSRLEYYCRSAPFNWFNFYDFWHDINVLCWLCIGLAVGSAVANADPRYATPAWDLPQLMRELAHVTSASGRFTERKTSQMLSAPLVTSGTLTYVAPDRVQKTILTPVEELFELNRNQVTITGGPDRQTHHFSLDDNSRIMGLVQAIRATLAGDLPTLNRFYEVQCTGDVTNWQLQLKPRDASLAGLVAWIRIEGSEDRIDSIETESGNGDHSEMSVKEDVTNVR